MGQIFHPSANTLSRVSILGAVVIMAAVGGVFAAIIRSPYVTQVGVVRDQPVPFSHKHHVEGLGIDCRFCHTGVERSAFAGIPPTKTCMMCHAQIWADSALLEPVRRSFREDSAIRWTRVHDLPDFVYFDHSVHVAKGVACRTCHGRIDEMPLAWREHTLQMEWCLECHRHAERSTGPIDRVYRMTDLEPAAAAGSVAANEATWLPERDENGVLQLTNCSVCHR